MYTIFITLRKLSLAALVEISHDHGVVFAHHEELGGNVKVIMCDDEDQLLGAINEVLEYLDSGFEMAGLVEGTPLRLTL